MGNSVAAGAANPAFLVKKRPVRATAPAALQPNPFSAGAFPFNGQAAQQPGVSKDTVASASVSSSSSAAAGNGADADMEMEGDNEGNNVNKADFEEDEMEDDD